MSLLIEECICLLNSKISPSFLRRMLTLYYIDILLKKKGGGVLTKILCTGTIFQAASNFLSRSLSWETFLSNQYILFFNICAGVYGMRLDRYELLFSPAPKDYAAENLVSWYSAKPFTLHQMYSKLG